MAVMPRSDGPIPFFRGLTIAVLPSLLLWGMIVLAVHALT